MAALELMEFRRAGDGAPGPAELQPVFWQQWVVGAVAMKAGGASWGTGESLTRTRDELPQSIERNRSIMQAWGSPTSASLRNPIEDEP